MSYVSTYDVYLSVLGEIKRKPVVRDKVEILLFVFSYYTPYFSLQDHNSVSDSTASQSNALQLGAHVGY
jgi:hypothetical protein